MPYKQTSLFSERVADQEVIKNLLREIARLKGEKPMSRIIKDVNGKYWLVHDAELLSEDEVQGHLANLQSELSELEAIAPANNGQLAPAAAVEASQAEQPVSTEPVTVSPVAPTVTPSVPDPAAQPVASPDGQPVMVDTTPLQ